MIGAKSWRFERQFFKHYFHLAVSKSRFARLSGVASLNAGS
ncbi:hypothetical protein MNBD_ALPHA11-1656 [hydrothermal vent metagenome]|uniref:Uncharacterized protein n=1 Tax=hydrothermal vent metagenome TaxID=652676 RepID=A0A3B0U9M1_9ZZZZ